MKKRILALLLSCAMALGGNMAVAAQTPQQYEGEDSLGGYWHEGEGEWINPLADKPLPFFSGRASVFSVPSTGANSYSTVTSAAKYVKRQMLARNEAFTYEYTGSNLNSANIQQTINRVFDKACGITSSPVEGDYLRYHLTYIRWSFRYTSTKAEITWSIQYASDAAREQTMKSRIQSAVAGLSLTYDSDVVKIKKIHDYICKNVTYYSDGTWNSHSAYSALVDKRAVCQGYATLFYAMCKQAGVGVRCVSGNSNGQSHLWNLVKIENSWYNLDATWDSVKSGVSYNYFLKSDKDFKGHIRDMEYTTVDFHSQCPMSAVSYSGAVGTPVLKSAVSAGSTRIKLSWSKVGTAEGYYIYYAVGSGGAYKKLKTVRGGAYNSLNISGLVPGKTYYFKIRAYSGVFGDCVSGDSGVKSARPRPEKVGKPSVTAQKGALKVKWKTVEDVKGYDIVITYKRGGETFKKKVTVRASSKKRQSKKVKNLPHGAVCKVKVRAFTSGANGGSVYGNYSQTRRKPVK